MNCKNVWRGTVSLLFLALLQWSLASGQDFDFPELNRFEIVTSYPVYTPDNLWNYINGGADAYNALGFRDLHIAEYKRGKKHTVKLEIYHHASVNLAFGIYALERAPSYDFFKLGTQAYREKGLIHFLKGEYYVKLTSHSGNRKILEALEELAYITEDMLEGTIEFPPALSMFPEKGKQENTEMYIAENVLGHEFLGKAFRSTYKIDDKRFTIYLFTENTSDENRQMLEAYLSKYGLSAGDEPGEKFHFEDGYNGFVYLAWEEGIVILISGLNENHTELAYDYMSEILDRYE
ncbi:MAG TPA: hypothetical protein ENH59_08095 [Bacteroidetes bacterium]|nr:hypothetical protein [Bacteroidota bacterium]